MQRTTQPGVFQRLRRAFQGSGLAGGDLDKGLDRIAHRLGLECSADATPQRSAARCVATPTAACGRSIYYAPDMDGQADPGEVVWMWVPGNSHGEEPQERAIVVVGRNRHTILGLLISPNQEHADEDTWLDIGAGSWDHSGRQCWVRLDKVLEVPEDVIRRQGAVMPRRRFDRIAHRLRDDFGWR